MIDLWDKYQKYVKECEEERIKPMEYDDWLDEWINRTREDE
jgi:hypothetical protein